ncbi:cation:proton antiporter domain-containing protein [Paenibacillus sp. YAF4_2]|uniref:cation:proton antiporter domain-containing protein n=1 Tax=Paenibacillus sp. YAF4_2 TaxID=3233085 RepID=UPI003F9DDC9E
MEASGSYGGLMLVVAVSFIIPIVLLKLRLRVVPVVVAEIIAGLILGNSGFQVVGKSNWLDLLSLLGFIYLMFLSGLEIDFSSLRGRNQPSRKAYNPLVVAITIFTGIFLVSSVISIVLASLGYVNQLFLTTLIISTVSLGVVVPVLKERQLLSSPLGQTLLFVTVLADFFTMILLAVYVSSLSNNKMDMLLLVSFFIVLAVVYYVIRYLASNKIFKILRESSVQFGTRAIFTLLLSVVFLSEKLGVENILGAFLAGVIVSMLKPQKAFVHQLESFGYGFLIPVFFVMVGVRLDLRPLLEDPKMLTLIPLLLLLMFLAKFIPMLLLKRWYSFRDVVSSALLLSSKLSLVIAAATLALELHIIDSQLHGAFILVAIVSCLLFPVLFNKLASPPVIARRSIAFIGLNHISIPVISELLKDSTYLIKIYTSNKDLYLNVVSGKEQRFKDQLVHVNQLTIEELEGHHAFEADSIIVVTNKDNINNLIGTYVRAMAGKHLILRIEDPDLYKQLRDQGVEVFSTLYAAQRVLKALIESPGALRLLEEDDNQLAEIEIRQFRWTGKKLKDIPWPPNLLVMRIYRNHSAIIPNGGTVIQFADRLLLCGEASAIEEFRQIFIS